jgi:superfamily I DNA/RNA helicase
MVDEYQDTNTLQYRLLRSLLGPHNNLCVVGDDDQSIYAFRGADRDLILNFPRQFPAAEVVTLTANYRCSSQIVNVANTVMRASSCRYDKQLIAANGRHSAVRCVDVLDEDSELQFIVDDVRHSQYSPSEVAILCRSGKHVNAAKRVLAHHKIPLGAKLNGVNVMTLHASKGLEFPVVYLPGVQEDILPNWNAINAGSVEEERRLFYVGVTRAERQLTLTAAQYRGEYESQRSRFAEELLAARVVQHHELAVPS